MELTRRDAAAALATLGVGGAAAVGTDRWRRDDGDGDDDGAVEPAGDRRVRDTMVALAEVLYPSEVSGTEAFVEEFLAGRLDREGHAEGLREAVADLDRLAEAWHGDRVAALDPETRDRLLREVGADTADEDPHGTVAERVRYYLVNDLLLALYASPTGGELVGIENPQGHPGGIDSYQRRPQS